MKKNGNSLKLQGDIEKHAWVKFAGHALDLADGDNARELCDEAADIADAMVEQFRKRVG
jgi:hypothetical protein